MESTVRDRVREHILETFYVADPGRLDDEESLIESGLVDSTGMMDLVFFVEEAFRLTISDEETTPENLESIAAIVAFVARKQQEARVA